MMTNPPLAGRREWIGLAVLALPTLLVSFDVFVMLLAVPHLSEPTIYGIKELARDGWQPLPALAIIAGGAVGILFIRRQHRLADPLLDLRLFNNGVFSTALLCLLSYSMLSGTTMAFIGQHLQLVEGLLPLWTSLAMAPGMLVSIVSFQLASWLAHRVRPAHLIAVGLLVTIAGLLVITFASATSGPAILVLGFTLSTLGSGPVVTLGTDLVVGSALAEKAGSAALSQTSNEFGISLGIGTLGSIGTLVYRTQIAGALAPDVPPPASQAARNTLAGATVAASHLSNRICSCLHARPSPASCTPSLSPVRLSYWALPSWS